MNTRIILFWLSIALLAGCEQKGSSSAPIALPEAKVRQLEGTAGVSDGGRAFADIYNGTDWTIVDVDLSVTNIPTGESRRVRLTCYKEVEEAVPGRSITRTKKESTELLPFSSGSFEGSSGNFLDGLNKEQKSYSIESARGYTK
jgi:hypothetical protein